jgi:signal transduction histidine kinase
MRRWQHLALYVAALVLCWAGLAAWQWHEYGHERESAQQSLDRQAESIMSALVGGIRSHRRLGPFYQDQLQATLDDLAKSEDTLAVAIANPSGSLLLAAGKTELLKPEVPTTPGESWTAEAFRSVVAFHLDPEPPRGRGPGGGQGRGRGPWRQAAEDQQGMFSQGGDYLAVLLLDRRPVDARLASARWLRSLAVLAGGLVLVGLGVAWLATVRLAEARGHTRVLEAEARHLRDLGQAAAGLAHETRNPLGLIRGWTQRLAESDLRSPEQRQQAQAVLEECDRVTARINQFLAFAKPVEPKREPVDVGQLIGQLAAILEPDLDSKSLSIDHAHPDSQPTVQADREMLRQALFNLFRNAIQFSPEGGAVEVRTQNGHAGGCRIEVADRGPGVPADQIDRLFTPYFTTRPDGTGLGLAIVRRIAVAHGWQSGYTPRPGGGSVFWLEVHG